jgi:hypothetical protein
MTRSLKQLTAAAALLVAGTAAQAALVQMYNTNLTGSALDSYADAVGVIAAASGPDVTVNDNTVNYSGDSFPGGAFGDPPDDRFVMRVTGTLDTSLYGYLRLYHDDGFRFSINGGTFFEFNGNTAPRFTNSLALANVGIVNFEMIFWDQGGAQVAQLYGCNGSDTNCVLAQVGNPVPTPGSLALAGLGLALAGVTLRRRKA